MTVSLVLVIIMGVLFAAGVYAMLERSLTRVLIGFLLLGNAANLFLLFGYLLPWLAALAVVAGIGIGLVQALRRIPRLSNNSRSDSDNPPQTP